MSKMTVNQVLVVQKAVREKLNSLRSLRDQVSRLETYMYAREEKKIVEPQYEAEFWLTVLGKALYNSTTTLTTEWECVEHSSITYIDKECHERWRWYRREDSYIDPATGVGIVTLEMRYPPNCEDKTEQHCLREIGYVSNGTVIWRKP